MRVRNFILALAAFSICFAANGQIKSKASKQKVTLEEVNFEDLIHRYFGKEKFDQLEGIYTVSCVITKRSKKFLSKREKIRIVGRRDNYAKVAIIKDWPGANRDYLEITLSYRNTRKYPVVGDINTLSEGKGYIYKHLEPNGSTISFSMISESVELLEAEYSNIQKRKTITYRLSYLKTYPKATDVTVFNTDK